MRQNFLFLTEGQTDKRAEKQIDTQTERHTGVIKTAYPFLLRSGGTCIKTLTTTNYKV